MTDDEGNRKICLARGIQEGLETVPGEAEGNSQLFPGPTESREPDGFFCCPRDQSLFVLLYHYMHNKIVIHNWPIKKDPLTNNNNE